MGLKAYYTKEELMNKLVIVVCNLDPKNVAGFVSEGMGPWRLRMARGYRWSLRTRSWLREARSPEDSSDFVQCLVYVFYYVVDALQPD